MRKSIIALAAAIAILLFAFLPAGAITFGSIDGNLHPNVGALIAEFSPGEKDLLCSGTLISRTVFMTASHCTAYLASIGIAPDQVWVTFDPSFGQVPHSTKERIIRIRLMGTTRLTRTISRSWCWINQSLSNLRNFRPPACSIK